MYQMGAAMAAPYVGGYIVFTEEEMNNLVAVGAQVARWYDWPEVMNERAQDHLGLVMLVGVIARDHYAQFQAMQARRAPNPAPRPMQQTAAPNAMPTPEAIAAFQPPDVTLPTPEEVAAMERDRQLRAAD